MLSAANDGKEDRPVRSVARYLREPVWAFGAAEPAAALRLVGKTIRHHCANWLRRGRDDGSQFTVALDLGASHPSTVTLRAVGGDITILYEIFAEEAYRVPERGVGAGERARRCRLRRAYRPDGALLRQRIPARASSPSSRAPPTSGSCKGTRARSRGSFPCRPASPIAAARHASIRTARAGATRQAAPWQHVVEAITLDDIRGRFGIDGIDLLKLDVEGAERAVLAAGIGKVRAIAAELHEPYTLDRFAATSRPCASLRALATTR